MDPYTAATREWLEQRYKRPAAGPYVPHQPLGGFHASRDAAVLRDYVRIYRILKALAHLSFESLLDVGAAEGWVAALAARLSGARVEVTDLSQEACDRATELFALTARAADVHRLPYPDRSFDVVLCSETLEHVVDVDKALRELLRVARTAVVVTVPHESAEEVERNKASGEPHGHVHAFDLDRFESLRKVAADVMVTPIMSRWTRIPIAFIEGRALGDETRRRVGVLSGAYDRVRPLLRRLPSRRLLQSALEADERLCHALPGHDGILAIIFKRSDAWSGAPLFSVRPGDLLSRGTP